MFKDALLTLQAFLIWITTTEGMYSLSKCFFRYNFIYDVPRITKQIIDNSSHSRLYLNTHVKSVKYSTKRPNIKNTLIYLRNGKEHKRTFDYVIICFPLTRDIQKHNFHLDILYRDYLDCQLSCLNEYLIDGTLSLKIPDGNNKLVNLYTDDPKYNFKSIRAKVPCKKPDHAFFDLVLYSVVSMCELNEARFDTIFEPGILLLVSWKYTVIRETVSSLFIFISFTKGYKIIKRLPAYTVPFYKKVRFSQTPFPQVVIDDENRSRTFYLASQKWFIGGSKETSCMSARNIALLIAKKELGEDFMKKPTFKSSNLFNFHTFFSCSNIKNSLLSFSLLNVIKYYILSVCLIFKFSHFARRIFLSTVNL